MVEESIFKTNDDIVKWVNKNYDLQIVSVKSCDLGSANCFYLKSESNLYFMKEFQSKITYDNLKTEVEVCKHLLEKGFRTSEFIENVNGEYIATFNGKYIHIQKYIKGTSFQMFEMPEPLLYKSASYLGKINKFLADFAECESSFDDEWLNGWSHEKEIAKLNSLLEERSENIEESILKRIYEDFEFKKTVLKKMQGYAKRFISSYKCNSHGDYSLLQILFEKGELEAVIDFTSVCYLPPTWEIIRSYSYAASECKDGNAINYSKFKKYLDAYLSESDIPARDIVLMPSLYFFNLIRSTFGYKQLLKENSKQSIEFAFWRTNLCRWLYTHLEEFEGFLQQQYGE